MRQKTIRGYKFIRDDMTSKNGKLEKWELGVWKRHDGKLIMCSSGFHACESPLKAFNYNYGNRLFIVEARGLIIHERGGDKFCAEEMRIVREVEDVKRISVLLSIWAARRCLKNYERKYPKDKRVALAIEAAEAWVKNPCDKTRSAAESAAWSAESAARGAAWSAESAARSAAWSAESAAWSAESATRSAAWSAESAAWSVAWSVAWSAAEKKLLSLIRAQLRKQKEATR